MDPNIPEFPEHEGSRYTFGLMARTLALCVTGSIAAYKAASVARLWIQAGGKVVVVMTRSAQEFVGAATFAGITGERAYCDMWDAGLAGEIHISLSERADVVGVVPATADVLARLAHGRADDLVTALALAARCPVVAAPAMHPRMWEHPATRQNVRRLAQEGRVTFVGPVEGAVASGDIGVGRMAEPAAIVAALDAALAPKDLAGRRVLVTAGPTLEDVDPVRFLGNRSSGKMGFAVAARAAARGAHVTLVAGPVALPTPWGVRRVDVRSALDLRGAIRQAVGVQLDKVDAVVMAAAVADYRPGQVSKAKLEKAGPRTRLDLVRNPDLLAELGLARGKRRRPVLVGFAMETGNQPAVVARASRKLAKKKIDLIVANEAGQAFGGDDNEVTFVTAEGSERSGRTAKLSIADAILDRVRARFSS